MMWNSHRIFFGGSWAEMLLTATIFTLVFWGSWCETHAESFLGEIKLKFCWRLLYVTIIAKMMQPWEQYRFETKHCHVAFEELQIMSCCGQFPNKCTCITTVPHVWKSFIWKRLKQYNSPEIEIKTCFGVISFGAHRWPQEKNLVPKLEAPSMCKTKKMHICLCLCFRTSPNKKCPSWIPCFRLFSVPPSGCPKQVAPKFCHDCRPFSWVTHVVSCFFHTYVGWIENRAPMSTPKFT